MKRAYSGMGGLGGCPGFGDAGTLRWWRFTRGSRFPTSYCLRKFGCWCKSTDLPENLFKKYFQNHQDSKDFNQLFPFINCKLAHKMLHPNMQTQHSMGMIKDWDESQHLQLLPGQCDLCCGAASGMNLRFSNSRTFGVYWCVIKNYLLVANIYICLMYICIYIQIYKYKNSINTY